MKVAKNQVKISKMSKIYQKVRLGKRRKVDTINSNHDDKHSKEEKPQKKTKETEAERKVQQAKQLEEGEIL